MREFTEEYGYFSSGIFALALSQALDIKLVAVQAHNFVIHVCCEHENVYLDAFGVSNQAQLLGRVVHEYQKKDISLRFLTKEALFVLTRYKPEELKLAEIAVQRFLEKVKLPPVFEERNKCA